MAEDWDWEVFSVDKYPRSEQLVFPLDTHHQCFEVDYENASFVEVLEVAQRLQFQKVYVTSYSLFFHFPVCVS